MNIDKNQAVLIGIAALMVLVLMSDLAMFDMSGVFADTGDLAGAMTQNNIADASVGLLESLNVQSDPTPIPTLPNIPERTEVEEALQKLMYTAGAGQENTPQEQLINVITPEPWPTATVALAPPTLLGGSVIELAGRVRITAVNGPLQASIDGNMWFNCSAFNGDAGAYQQIQGWAQGENQMWLEPMRIRCASYG